MHKCHEDQFERQGLNSKDCPKDMLWLFNEPDVEQKSEEWFKLRSNYLSGSEVGSALGENKYTSREELAKSKAQARLDIASGFFKKSIPSRIMLHGILNESIAAAKYVEVTGEKVFNIGFVRHPTIPFLGVSPDLITLNGNLIEIKCPAKRRVFQSNSVDKIRLYFPEYWHQCQLQAAVCGLKNIFFVEYGVHPNPNHPPGNDVLSITRIPVDHDWLPRYLPLLTSFWSDVLSVQNKIQSKINNSTSNDEHLPVSDLNRTQNLNIIPLCPF